MADQFIHPIPKPWLDNTQKSEWCRAVTLLLDDITREGGVIATGEATTAVVLTQQEKLDLMTITAAADLDDIAPNTASVAEMQSGSPAYSISNDGTDRTFSADAAAGTISPTYLAADLQRNQTATLEQGDVLATLIRDLKLKGILG
jgi:hypothetical protein